MFKSLLKGRLLMGRLLKGHAALVLAIVFSVWVIGWRSAPARAQCCGNEGSSHGGSGHDQHAGHQHPVSGTRPPLITEQPPHDGQISATELQHFEVVYQPRETRVYLYSRFQRPIPAYGVQGQVSMRVRGNDEVFRYPLRYAAPPAGSIEQDYLVAVVDVTRIRDGDMMVTFDLANLPYRQEPRATFTQTFAISRGRPQVTTVALNEADKAGIARQQVCPVTGGRLGSMGTPVKVLLGDQPLYLCCKGCIGKVKENPESYLRKMGAAPPQPNTAAVAKGFVITQATAADEAAIRTQRVCPVMNTQLGGHGVPIKVTLNGRSLFVCCGGCTAKLKESPDYYFAQRSP